MLKRILIIDDSPTMRTLEKATLQRNDNEYEILSAQDGAKAYRVVRIEKLDLIITDINMPNMDGIEFIGKVRSEDTPNKSVPILVVSTEGGDDTKQSGKIAGASGWIVKPFQPETLLAAVEKLLSKAIKA